MITTPEPEFRIRAYYVSELAVLYHPYSSIKSATRLLRRWIYYNSDLERELKGLGYFSGQRCFTPKQVACIIKHLGEP